MFMYVFILTRFITFSRSSKCTTASSASFSYFSWEVLRECIEKCEELGIKVVELLEVKGPKGTAF